MTINYKCSKESSCVYNNKKQIHWQKEQSLKLWSNYIMKVLDFIQLLMVTSI